MGEAYTHHTRKAAELQATGADSPEKILAREEFRNEDLLSWIRTQYIVLLSSGRTLMLSLQPGCQPEFLLASVASTPECVSHLDNGSRVEHPQHIAVAALGLVRRCDCRVCSLPSRARQVVSDEQSKACKTSKPASSMVVGVCPAQADASFGEPG